MPAPDHSACTSPLVFDLVDTLERALDRRLHAITSSHPGGRNYETFPVNAYEAEGRRLARFEADGHTAGPMVPAPTRVNPEYPVTLDLRRRAG